MHVIHHGRNRSVSSRWLPLCVLLVITQAMGCLPPRPTARFTKNTTSSANTSNSTYANLTASNLTSSNFTAARIADLRSANSTIAELKPLPDPLPLDPLPLAPPAEPPASEEPSKPSIESQVAEETGFDIAFVDTPPTEESEVKVDPLDWIYCRGPEFNGTSRETGLIDDFDPKGGEGSNVAWVRNDLGGRSTPIVMNGKLYTLLVANPGTRKQGERVVCLDAASGEMIWERQFNVYLSDVPIERVGWSSCAGDPTTGRLYAQGVCGTFMCLDAETGQALWTIPLHERFGLLSTYGGRTNFPLIVDDMVIVSAVVIGWGDAAKPCHQFIALDKETGDVVWFHGTRPLPYDTTYSAPSLASFGGQLAMVVGSGDGAVWAIQPRTGNHIWQYRLARRGLNTPPLVVGEDVYAGNAEENIDNATMGAVVRIDGSGTGDVTESGEKWLVPESLVVGRSAPLMIEGRLWVFDDKAKLHVLDPETGEPVATKLRLGTMMRSNPLYADGKVYACTANGRWYILEPDEERGAKILNKGRLPNGEGMDAGIICSHGRIYLQTSGSLYCLADPDKEPGVSGETQPIQEAAVEDKAVAHVQVVPADVLMAPGEQQDFTVRLYNRMGQELDAAEATFSVNGNGEISSGGTFTAAADAHHSAAFVTAKVGELEGVAKIRIVPELPWSFDFEDISIDEAGKGEPPVTWVGARYRHVVREVDGNKVMVKVTTIPKGKRSRCWFGHPELHDYTIQADVRGAITNAKMPDIGLIAQGYALDLQGASQMLQIRSWVTQERIAEIVDFQWLPDTWYTMKFRAANEDGMARLQGKVWPKGEPEPETWTVEVTGDEFPVQTGSPGLYGNAKDAEIFLDNISVTPNGDN